MAGRLINNVLDTLPLDKLFGAPFNAAALAQSDMAHETAGFIRQYGMDASGNVWLNTLTTYYDIPVSSVSDVSYSYLIDPSGGGIFFPPGKHGVYFDYFLQTDTNLATPDTADVSLNNNLYSRLGIGWPDLYVSMMLTDDDKVKDQNSIAGGATGYKKRLGNRVYLLDEGGKVAAVQGMRSISVPFISMINIPSLCIDVVKVDFTIKISTQTLKTETSDLTSTSQLDQAYSGSGSGWTWGQNHNYNNSGSTNTTAVSTSKAKSEQDDSTECTYTVSMTAKQMEPPGLAAVMNFITNNKDTAARKILTSDGVKRDPANMKLQSQNASTSKYNT